MAGRFLAWLSAGVLLAGVSAGTILGAGLAFADDDPSGDAGTSQSTSPDTQQDSDVDNTDADPPAQEDEETEDVVEDDDEEVPAEDVDEPTSKPEDNDDEVDEPAAVESKSDTLVTRSVVATRAEPEPAPEPEPTPVKPEKIEEPDETVVAAPVEAVTVDAPFIDEVEPSPATARVMMTAAADVPAPARPSLINVIGTLAWSVADFFINLVVGPPVVPAGYSVTAGRSTMKIDCGDGYHAQADWYFPTSGEPDKLIYFQHGFLSPAATYNVTLTELAERNNAIVVAPSITSNYFSCDGCSVTADPMHLAVAKLFAGDRTALRESAAAAGFEGTLPTQFALAGHSAGSMLAAGTSGYYYERASEEQKADLVGVLLYDGSAANGALARALEKLPDAVPVLNIAGGPTVFNNGGEANQVFSEMRPDQFNGVQLVGGAHSDGFRSSIYGGLVQAFVGLAFGQSQPQDVEAVQVLTQGWLADMFAGRVYDEDSRTGIYGDVGEIVDIDTDAGLARGYVLPGPPAALSPIERFFAALLHSINSNDFAACAVDPDAGFFAQNSTPNTVLSLDGKAITRQSVGQQCMDG
ncbi:hypothetical protein SAMN04489835_0052 [Mycolicibacterium rutilum]|uniref:Alpha/beta hydrolase family protein n=1 Tax=Mycolicibacterium rutilum TaxID=370526 RepID=A0A1H6IB94_MYCRU|nr:hypothetical protein [Mycolicibacterium rutilum]SEH46052.1 hypothetical protein SAMN04489835_0052 [Mycolicibacterium rutilum]